MATRFVKGMARTESPRMKDVPELLPAAGEPTVQRGADGRFARGNRIAENRSAKETIADSLTMASSDPESAEVSRNAMVLYRAVMRSMPNDGPAVRTLVMAQARHAALATAYANAAAQAGIATPAGLVMAEASRRHDTAAQRISVSAYDRAVKEANKPTVGGERRDPLYVDAPKEDT